MGLSYKVSDVLGVFGGVRYVFANNSFNGFFRNLVINPEHPVGNPAGGFIKATNFFENIGDLTYSETTADKELNTLQYLWGITPIIGLHFSPSEELNVSLRFEYETRLKLTNETIIDETKAFPVLEKSETDFPATISLGATYKILRDLTLAISGNYFFDRQANYGRIKTRTAFSELTPYFLKTQKLLTEIILNLPLVSNMKLTTTYFLVQVFYVDKAV